MKIYSLFLLLLATQASAWAQQKTATDGDWAAQRVTLKNTAQADVMIRVGDIDNLGFGWEEGYNPFSGRSTSSHSFPWDINAQDIKGMDCILIGSSVGKKEAPCGSDGYTASVDYTEPANRPTPIEIPTSDLKGVKIQSAVLQIFIDDFQAPTFCSQFQMTIGGVRCTEGERILNAVEQGGPVGKFISVQLSDIFIEQLQKGDKISLLIDDPTTGATDGFAIDFVRLLINPKAAVFAGKGAGYVLDAETREPVREASVELRGFGTVKTNKEGYFEFNKLPYGLAPVDVLAKGYSSGGGVMDVMQDELNPIEILLTRGAQSVEFNGKKLQTGDAVVVNNLQFNQASAQLRTESRSELDKIAELLKKNPTMVIELSGHTSSEGERQANIGLSLRRVESCKNYLIEKGIASERILTAGYGPDRPIANNNLESERAKNRRVEMRVMKM